MSKRLMVTLALFTALLLLPLILGCGGGGTSNLPNLPNLKDYLGSLIPGDVVKLQLDESNASIHWENETTDTSGDVSYTEENEYTMSSDGCMGLSTTMRLHELQRALVGLTTESPQTALVAIEAHNWGSYTNLRNTLINRTFVGVGVDKHTAHLLVAQINSSGDVTIYKAWKETAFNSPYQNISESCDTVDYATGDSCYSLEPGVLPPTLSANMQFDGQKLSIDMNGHTLTLMAGYTQEGRLIVIADSGAGEGMQVLVDVTNDTTPDLSGSLNLQMKYFSSWVEDSNIIVDTDIYLQNSLFFTSPSTMELKSDEDNTVIQTFNLTDNSANWPGVLKGTSNTETIYIVPFSSELGGITAEVSASRTGAVIYFHVHANN